MQSLGKLLESKRREGMRGKKTTWNGVTYSASHGRSLAKTGAAVGLLSSRLVLTHHGILSLLKHHVPFQCSQPLLNSVAELEC